MAAKTKNELKKMKVKDLVAHAMEFHGLVVDLDKENKDSVIAMIWDAQEDEGEVPGEDVKGVKKDSAKDESSAPPASIIPETKKTDKKASVDEQQKAAGEKRRWIKILNEAGDLGDQPVFLGCSGDEVLVKREQWVHLKQKHINQLDAAIATEFSDRKPRNVKRYRYEVSDSNPAEAL